MYAIHLHHVHVVCAGQAPTVDMQIMRMYRYALSAHTSLIQQLTKTLTHLTKYTKFDVCLVRTVLCSSHIAFTVSVTLMFWMYDIVILYELSYLSIDFTRTCTSTSTCTLKKSRVCSQHVSCATCRVCVECADAITPQLVSISTAPLCPRSANPRPASAPATRNHTQVAQTATESCMSRA